MVKTTNRTRRERATRRTSRGRRTPRLRLTFASGGRITYHNWSRATRNRYSWSSIWCVSLSLFDDLELASQSLAQTELHRKAAEETRLYRERNVNLDATVTDLRAQLEQAQQALPPPSPTLALQPEHSLVFGHADSYLTRPSTPMDYTFATPAIDFDLPDMSSVPAYLDTFNLYADADAPVRPTSYISAPVHHPFMPSELTVSAGALPALSYSPESLPDDLAPVCVLLS